MRKKRFFIAVLFIVALCSAIVHASAEDVIQKDGLVYVPDHSVYFADVDKTYSWAVQPVDYLAYLRIVSGTDHCIYSPNDALTRADFVTMLTRAYNMNDFVGENSFPDVPTGMYYSNAVSAAKNLGIVSGDEHGKFHPTKPLSRQDAMVMLRRTLDKTGLIFPDGSLSHFADSSAVSDYAANDIAALAQAKIITGSGNKINPKASVTRAEMAVMLYRAMMLEDNEKGEPVYIAHANVINLCIGSAFYPNVTIDNAKDGQNFSGLYECIEMRGAGEDFIASLGASRSMNDEVIYQDGTMTVNGETMTVAENAAAICVNPYGLISTGFVSTGKDYKKASVSIVDNMVTAVYYDR